jgi:hypothetical protein
MIKDGFFAFIIYINIRQFGGKFCLKTGCLHRFDKVNVQI